MMCARITGSPPNRSISRCFARVVGGQGIEPRPLLDPQARQERRLALGEPRRGQGGRRSSLEPSPFAWRPPDPSSLSLERFPRLEDLRPIFDNDSSERARTGPPGTGQGRTGGWSARGRGMVQIRRGSAGAWRRALRSAPGRVRPSRTATTRAMRPAASSSPRARLALLTRPSAARLGELVDWWAGARSRSIVWSGDPGTEGTVGQLVGCGHLVGHADESGHLGTGAVDSRSGVRKFQARKFLRTHGVDPGRDGR